MTLAPEIQNSDTDTIASSQKRVSTKSNTMSNTTRSPPSRIKSNSTAISSPSGTMKGKHDTQSTSPPNHTQTRLIFCSAMRLSQMRPTTTNAMDTMLGSRTCTCSWPTSKKQRAILFIVVRRAWVSSKAKYIPPASTLLSWHGQLWTSIHDGRTGQVESTLLPPLQQ